MGDGATTSTQNYESVILTKPQKYVASVEMNRPKTKNAFALETADEFVKLFKQLEEDSSVRCVLLSGKGVDFTSGVDIKSFMGVYAELQAIEDVAHRARMLRSMVERFQAPFKAMHAFGKPIICVQHGLSLGLAMELAACSDIRLCSRDTRMAIREVLIGIAADVGSLQLMPRLAANQSLLNELIYTGRYITMEEALMELKFVSRVCDTKELAMAEALDLATTIASRSPVAVQGAKRNLRFSREHSFETGLDYNAIWNAAMMQGGDVVKAISAIMSKQEEPVDYDDL